MNVIINISSCVTTNFFYGLIKYYLLEEGLIAWSCLIPIDLPSWNIANKLSYCKRIHYCDRKRQLIDVPVPTMKAYGDRGGKTLRFLKPDVRWVCKQRYDPATLLTPYNRVLLDNRNSSAASQEISRLGFHYCVHNRPPLVSVLSWMNNSPLFILEHFNINLLYD